MERWVRSVVWLGIAVLVLVVEYRDGNFVIATAIGLAFLALAWWALPSRRGPHVSHADAQSSAKPDDIIIYWRPG